MSYYVNYAGMDPEARREAALEDIKTWLGKRFATAENSIRPYAVRGDAMSFAIAASFLGVEGVPVREWFLHLGGTQAAWDEWLAEEVE